MSAGGRASAQRARDATADRRIARLAAAALLLLLLALASAAWQGPDVFYHLFLGKRILAGAGFQPDGGPLAEQPQYVNLYWLYQVVLEGLFRAGGVVAASLLFVAAWIGIALAWGRTARIARRPEIGLPLALVALLVVSGRFEPRPEIVSYLLLSLQIYWLSRWDFSGRLALRRTLLFAASEAIWANVHGYFVLGPLLVAARLAGALLGPEEREARRALALLLGATLLASCVSPFGPRAWQFSLALWSFLRAVGGAIVEFGPPTGAMLRLWTVKLFWLLWGVTLLLAGGLALRRRARPFALLTALAGLVLSAASARNLPLLPLMAAPLYASALAPAAARAAVGKTAEGRAVARDADGAGISGTRRRLARAVASLTGAAALALCVWVAIGGFHASLLGEGRFGFGLPGHTYPVRFARHLQDHPWSGKLFNNAADGGYLEYFFPDVRVYMDSRYVDEGVVRGYFAALADPQAFARLHAHWHFDGALLKVLDSPQLVLALLHDPNWRLAYADLQRAFFVVADPEGAAAAQAASPPRPAELVFYDGEDLSTRLHGMPAIQWTGLLLQAPDRGLLLQALEQFSRAPRIPSYVIQYALQYGLERGDREVLELGRRMYPRIYARDRAGREFVDHLMRSAPAR